MLRRARKHNQKHSSVTDQQQEPKAHESACGICGGFAYFDLFRDFNVWSVCRAHETTTGWQAPKKSESKKK